MRFEFYASGSPKPGWYWRLRAGNGRVVADGSEAYSTRLSVLRAIDGMRRRFMATGWASIDAREVPK